MPYKITSSIKMLVINVFSSTGNKIIGSNDINILDNNYLNIQEAKKN